jgi:streptogramin lyase
LDGALVVASRARGEFAANELALTQGFHDLRVRYADRTDHTFIRFYWRPPGTGGSAAYTLIPSDYLFPPQGDYAQIEVPPLATFSATPLAPGPSPDDMPLAAAAVEILASGLRSPRGVAVLGQTVYVAESGAGRVLAVDPAGGEQRPLAAGETAWVEPSDLAALPDGRLAVVDAGAARLVIYSAEGNTVQEVPADPALLDRARGIGVDVQGTLWIASTPGLRVVAVGAAGQVVRELVRPATPDTGEMQPVDVAAAADGSVWVTDVGSNRLYHLSPASMILSSHSLPVANSLDGWHVALDTGGDVYVTDPESGHILRLNGQGEPVAVYATRTAATPDAKPVGIAVDAQERIWVADVQGGRILRLTPAE